MDLREQFGLTYLFPYPARTPDCLAHLDACRRHVSRTHRRNRPDPRDVRASRASLYIVVAALDAPHPAGGKRGVRLALWGLRRARRTFCRPRPVRRRRGHVWRECRRRCGAARRLPLPQSLSSRARAMHARDARVARSVERTPGGVSLCRTSGRAVIQRLIDVVLEPTKPANRAGGKIPDAVAALDCLFLPCRFWRWCIAWVPAIVRDAGASGCGRDARTVSGNAFASRASFSRSSCR